MVLPKNQMSSFAFVSLIRAKGGRIPSMGETGQDGRRYVTGTWGRKPRLCGLPTDRGKFREPAHI